MLQKTLIIDDDIFFTNFLKKVIENNTNCEIWMVATGKEAAQIIKNYKSALILFDYHIPNINKIKTIRMLATKDKSQNTLVIVVSSADKKELKQAFKESTVIKCFDKAKLSKDTEIIKLLEIVKKNLNTI
jgi:response regulator of citrate/malate metabolism